MAQKLDPNCGPHIVVHDNTIYFQAGSKGLYRVPCDGSKDATQLDPNAGYLAVPGDDAFVYFQAGSKGLYRVPRDGSANATQLDPNGGNLVVDGAFVYFNATGHGLYRVPRDGKSKAVQLDPNCTDNLAVWNGYVYFEAGGKGLYRVPCDGSANATRLDPNAGYLVVPGDGYVYFQAGSKGLYRVPCDGSANATRLDPNAGHLVVPGDGYVYFQAGSKGLYRVPCDGSANATQLDPNCDRLVVFGDGYVYFQADKKGLYRVRCDGAAPANRLDPNCGYLTSHLGYIYFQGGPDWDALYRVGVAIPHAPAGLRVRVQDEYVVSSIVDADINEKAGAIKSLLTEAVGDTSDTLFLNFTSGASSGAYPDAVAGRINGKLAGMLTEVDKVARLGTVIMDFPDDNKNTVLVTTIFTRNTNTVLLASDWMGKLPEALKARKLSELSIPGTHDSCTWNASPISKCQNLNLEQQLEAGIRFIDIRCRHFKNKFELHHGSEYLGMDFDYVLETCTSFLSAHPGEAIIMSVKDEHEAAENTTTYEEVFMNYVGNYPDYWYLGDTVPQLSSVAGKIVVVRRFYIAPDSPNVAQRGIDLTAWVQDSTFTWPF